MGTRVGDLLACLLTHLLTHSLTHSLTYSLTYLLTYLLTCFLACLLVCLLTYLLTYLLTCLPTYLFIPWSSVLPEKLTGFSASQEIPRTLWNQRFITAFTSARHLSLFWASSIQSISPYPTSWRSILILSSHLCLGLPNGLSLSLSLSLRFSHENPEYASPLQHTRYMPRPSHSSPFYHPHNIGWGVQIIKLLTQFSLFLCYLVPLGPKYSHQHPVLKYPQPTFR